LRNLFSDSGEGAFHLAVISSFENPGEKRRSVSTVCVRGVLLVGSLLPNLLSEIDARSSHVGFWMRLDRTIGLDDSECIALVLDWLIVSRKCLRFLIGLAHRTMKSEGFARPRTELSDCVTTTAEQDSNRANVRLIDQKEMSIESSTLIDR
jgi:hypothetical protein